MKLRDESLLTIEVRKDAPVKPEPSKPKALFEITLINDLIAGTVVNVLGVATNVKGPKKTKGTDYSLSFNLIDQSVEGTSKSISVVMFKGTLKAFPIIIEGDIVRFTKMKVQKFENILQGVIADNGSSIISFDGSLGNSVIPRTVLLDGTIDKTDVSRIQTLRLWLANRKKNNVKIARRAVLKTEEIRENIYFDYIGQVLKVPVRLGTNPCEVILTDFSKNPGISHNPLQYGLDGWYPPSSLLIVTFWDLNAALAGNLKEGEFVMLRNLRGKINSMTGQLSAVMHTVNEPKDSIIQISSDDERLQSIKMRKFEILSGSKEEFHDVNSMTLQPKLPLTQLASIIFSSNPSEKYQCKVYAKDFYPKSLIDSTKHFCKKCQRRYSAFLMKL